MYMREMGTVDLLTREGELKIAKRIEKGQSQVLAALATYPDTIARIIMMFDKVETEELRLTDVINGFVEPNEPDEIPRPAPNPKNGEGEVEVYMGPDPKEAEKRIQELRRRYKTLIDCLNKYGYDHEKTNNAFENIAESFLEFKFLPSVFNSMVVNIRNTITFIRTQERGIMDLCVTKARMPRKEFILSFPENETNLHWIKGEIKADKGYSAALETISEDVIRAQRKLQDLERHSLLSISEIKEINRKNVDW